MSIHGTYSVVSYGEMVRSGPRVRAYAEALRAAITPGCTVLDIGAGFGFFAILACQFGAGRVIAVEPAEAITLGPDLARANGCADRITFVHGLSDDLGEESRADVIIADLRGVFPLFKRHIPTIADARARLLKPGGTLITQRDTLRCALVSDVKLAGMAFDPWDANAFDLDLSAGRRISVNTRRKTTASPEALISDPQNLAEVDYRTVTDPNVSGSASLVATRSAPAHGVLAWFDAELAGGQGFSNAPGQPVLVYEQMFFPFERPVEIAAGDRVDFDLDLRLMGEDYTSIWRTRIARTGAPELRFSQSSALAEFTTPADLRRRSGSHVPRPNARLVLDQHCLSRFDGATPLDTIAREVMEQAPDRFKNEAEALGYVAALAERYHGPV